MKKMRAVTCVGVLICLFLTACSSNRGGRSRYAAAPDSGYQSAVPMDTRKAPKPRRLSVEPPRVMLLIDEKSLGTIATSEIENLGIRELLKWNVPVIDQEMLRTNIKKQQNLAKMAGDPRGAAALGLQYGADIVIVGEAVAKPSARRVAGSNLRTYQAAVTLRAVRTDSGASLAASSETASTIALEDVAGGSKALKMAGAPAIEQVVADALLAWERSGGAQAGGGPVEIIVEGVDRAWKLQAVRQQFTSLDELENVLQRSYTSGAAVFTAETVLAASELSEKLILSAPDDLRIQVLDVGPGRIQIKVVEP